MTLGVRRHLHSQKASLLQKSVELSKGSLENIMLKQWNCTSYLNVGVQLLNQNESVVNIHRETGLARNTIYSIKKHMDLD